MSKVGDQILWVLVNKRTNAIMGIELSRSRARDQKSTDTKVVKFIPSN